MKGVDAPIVPVNLDGVWGSIFSFERGRFIWKLRRARFPIRSPSASASRCRPATPPFEVRRAVQKLQTEAYRYRKRPHAHACTDRSSAPRTAILSASPWETSAARA